MCRPESTCAPYKELVCDQSSPSSGGCPGNSGGSSRGELQTPTSISAPKPLNKVIKPQIITGERWWCFKALEPQNHCFPSIRTRSANSIVSLASLGFIISETKWLGCLFSNRLFFPQLFFSRHSLSKVYWKITPVTLVLQEYYIFYRSQCTVQIVIIFYPTFLNWISHYIIIVCLYICNISGLL